MAGTLDPKLKDAVTKAYKRGLAEGDRRASRQSQNLLLRELAQGMDAKTREAVAAAFDLGFMDGERQHCRGCRSRKVLALTTTNNAMFEMLNEIDKVEPVAGLILSFDEAVKTIEALSKGQRKLSLAKRLNLRLGESGLSYRLLKEQLRAGKH